MFSLIIFVLNFVFFASVDGKKRPDRQTLVPRLLGWSLLRPDDAQEDIEANLNRVDVEEAELVGDEAEVDGVDNGPDLPGPLASGEEVRGDLSVVASVSVWGEMSGYADEWISRLVD